MIFYLYIFLSFKKLYGKGERSVSSKLGIKINLQSDLYSSILGLLLAR